MLTTPMLLVRLVHMLAVSQCIPDLVGHWTIHKIPGHWVDLSSDRLRSRQRPYIGI